MFLFDYGRKEFHLKEVDKNVLNSVLDYFYTKEIHLTQTNLEKIVIFDEKLLSLELIFFRSNFACVPKKS